MILVMLGRTNNLVYGVRLVSLDEIQLLLDRQGNISRIRKALLSV